MNVKATPGLQCPVEGKPREYINDSETVEVADSTYYRRLLDDGSLVEVEAQTPPSVIKPAKGGQTDGQ